MYKISLLGPQGAGKGTQALLLAKRLGIPPLSMGQLIRDEINAKSEIGLRVKEIAESGSLVPDVAAAEILQKRLTRPDATNGYLIDGYPRDMAQMKAYEAFDRPTHVIVLEIPEEESYKRIENRLTCDVCGLIYAKTDGYTDQQLCECEKGRLHHRIDDTPEIIAKRLRIYTEQTIPVIELYRQMGIVHVVDGMGGIMHVQAEILKVLGEGSG